MRPTPVMMPAPGASPSYTPNAASWESSRNGEPGSSSRRRRSRGRSFPRSRCLARAASSPPCAARSTLARRSATSVAIAPAFAWNSSERGFSLLLMTGISPAAGGKPFVYLIQPVGAPEGFTIDDDEGRTERAAGDRFIHFGPGAVLDRLIADAGAHFVGFQPELRAHGDGAVGARDVHVVDEVGPVERPCQILGPFRVSCIQPIEGAARRNRGYRKDRRMAISHTQILRGADHVAQGVRAFHRYGRQRRAAGRLESDPEQERPPGHLATVFRRERVDLFARDIAVRRGEIEIEFDRIRHHAISIAIAVASPPPMHRVATPRLPPVFLSAPIRVTRMRAPEAPIGWPSAQAPPWILTLSCGNPCSFIAAMVTTAKASLISKRSTSCAFHPVRSKSLAIAPTGAVVNQPGSCACVDCPMTMASGARPRRSAVERRIITSAAAPSEIELELAAVTVPSLRKAGLSVGIFSKLALNGCSSVSMNFSSLPALIASGVSSQANQPSLFAFCARVSEAMANSSCAEREKEYFCAQSSAKLPISRPLS